MKDEEMAEEYRKDLKSKFFLSEPQLDLACQGYKDGFLAGLKAGRPQWHKVADGDLPEKEDVYLIYTTKGYLLGHYEQGGADGEIDFSGVPYSDFTEYPSEMTLSENEVIAWCEIPTFDKESE
jgi:hypothetical protein